MTSLTALHRSIDEVKETIIEQYNAQGVTFNIDLTVPYNDLEIVRVTESTRKQIRTILTTHGFFDISFDNHRRVITACTNLRNMCISSNNTPLQRNFKGQLIDYTNGRGIAR